jgi:hypothetical protein
MTPAMIDRELRAIRRQLVCALRVDTRYRERIKSAIKRLDLLDAAVELDRPKAGGNGRTRP